jgi:uncharacterized membrane protein YeaQ/YmgE (transglycosylase-associated protein family)
MHVYSVYVPQSVIAWLLIGLIAGWLAGKVSRGQGFGCIADIFIGLIGALLGGWIFTKLGILGGGFIYSIAAATIGAIVLVAIREVVCGRPRLIFHFPDLLPCSCFCVITGTSGRVPRNHNVLQTLHEAPLPQFPACPCDTMLGLARGYELH